MFCGMGAVSLRRVCPTHTCLLSMRFKADACPFVHLQGMGEALLWTAPTERLKVLRQSTAGEGVGGAVPSVTTILREQGIGGLYVGAGATALRQASSTAVRFATLDYIKTLVCCSCGYDKATAPSWVTFIAGGMGGATSAVMNNPIDGTAVTCSLRHLPYPSITAAYTRRVLLAHRPAVVKSRIQSGQHRGSMLTCVQALYAERGIAAFVAGLQVHPNANARARSACCSNARAFTHMNRPSSCLQPRCIRLFASQAIQFTIVDKVVQGIRGTPLGSKRVSVAGRI